MSWTYFTSPQTDKDRVRLLVGDTDTTDQQMQDEEIYTFLTLEGNASPQTVAASLRQVYRAAGNVASAIGARYARKVTNSMGRRKQEQETMMAHYLTLAKYLRGRASMLGVAPYAGGLSVAEKETNQENTDLVQPEFQRDMFSEPATEDNPPLTSTQAFT